MWHWIAVSDHVQRLWVLAQELGSEQIIELADFEFSNDAAAMPVPVMDDARKTALVQAEVQRMKCLPPSSAYVIHRLKVLNKMLQLLSKVSDLSFFDLIDLESFCSIIHILVFNVYGSYRVHILLSTGANKHRG